MSQSLLKNDYLMDLCSCVFSKGIVYLSFLYIIFAPALALYPSQPWLYMPLLGFISSLNPWLFGWISLLVVEPILAILNQQPEESPKKLIMSIQISTSNWRLLDDIPILVGNSQRQQWCYSTVASECSYASQSSLPDHQVEIPSNSDQPTNQPTGFAAKACNGHGDHTSFVSFILRLVSFYNTKKLRVVEGRDPKPRTTSGSAPGW